mmetsp:Transcript_70553/g.210391  ORF Transcript_70553/g.210391 Transcript_70553/m.210391 type:complete len:244 (-) Transcript_70553:7-738(-)
MTTSGTLSARGLPRRCRRVEARRSPSRPRPPTPTTIRTRRPRGPLRPCLTRRRSGQRELPSKATRSTSASTWSSRRSAGRSSTWSRRSGAPRGGSARPPAAADGAPLSAGPAAVPRADAALRLPVQASPQPVDAALRDGVRGLPCVGTGRRERIAACLPCSALSLVSVACPEGKHGPCCPRAPLLTICHKRAGRPAEPAALVKARKLRWLPDAGSSVTSAGRNFLQISLARASLGGSPEPVGV